MPIILFLGGERKERGKKKYIVEDQLSINQWHAPHQFFI